MQVMDGMGGGQVVEPQEPPSIVNFAFDAADPTGASLIIEIGELMDAMGAGNRTSQEVSISDAFKEGAVISNEGGGVDIGKTAAKVDALSMSM